MTLATLPDDSKDYQNIIWGDVSPLFHTIVTILAGLLSNQTIPTSGALFESRTRLIGWMLHFFASWFVCLPRQYDYSEAQEARETTRVDFTYIGCHYCDTSNVRVCGSDRLLS
jgi:hypothetical protein